MRFYFFLSFFLFFLSHGSTQGAMPPAKREVVTWLRSRADVFGCFLEGRLGFRDPKFNCKLRNYKNRSTPCDDGVTYGEGPRFPQEKMAEVHPAIRHLDLAWEHGELQAIHIELDKTYPDLTVEKMLRLPKKGTYPPNVHRIQFLQCLNKVSCVLIEGFESQNAGEEECRIPTSASAPSDPTAK